MFAAVSPLGRALWRLVAPADMDGLKPMVAGWIDDERWAQVESSYAEASLALRKLGRVGPVHAALASRSIPRGPNHLFHLRGVAEVRHDETREAHI